MREAKKFCQKKENYFEDKKILKLAEVK